MSRYRGQCGINREQAGHLMHGLDWAGAVADIRGAVQYLKSTGSRKVGVLGFCMGGALTIAASVLIPEVDAGEYLYLVNELYIIIYRLSNLVVFGSLQGRLSMVSRAVSWRILP